MAGHRFTAELWESVSVGSWVFVTVPPETSDDLRIEAGPPSGFGSVRVEVTIGSTTWRTSVFPDAKLAAYVLPVKKAVRTAERLQPDDVATLTLRVLD